MQNSSKTFARLSIYGRITLPVGIIGLPFIVLAPVFVLYRVGPIDSNGEALVILATLILVPASVYSLIDTLRLKVVLSPDKITRCGVRKTSIRFANVKLLRVLDDGIVVKDDVRTIRINRMIEGKDEIAAALLTRLRGVPGIKIEGDKTRNFVL